jgi:hypothetical protein
MIWVNPLFGEVRHLPLSARAKMKEIVYVIRPQRELSSRGLHSTEERMKKEFLQGKAN